MGTEGRRLGGRGVAAAIAGVVASALLIPGCGVIVDVPAFVRGTNIRPDGTCNEGFGDCNGDPDDGCETALGTDEACTACGDRCVNGNCVDRGGGRSCDCAPGFAACGGPHEGCLSDLANDPRNCGACGRDCSPGLCAKGVCQPGLVVHALTGYSVVPAPFVVDGGFIYLPGVETMVRAPAGATTEIEDAEIVFQTTVGMIEALAYDGTDLAWVERWDGSDVKATVFAGKLDGTARVLLADGEDIQRGGVFDSIPIALDETSAYWVATAGTGEDAAPITLRRAALDGLGGPSDVYTSMGAFGDVAVGATEVYWTDGSGVLHTHPKADLGLHVDIPLGQSVSFVNAVGARVCVSSHDFMTTKELHFFCGQDADAASFHEIGNAPSGQVGSLVFDARALYYTDVIGAELAAIDEADEHPTTVAPTVGWAGGVILRDGDIYWRAYNGIWRLRHANDAPK